MRSGRGIGPDGRRGQLPFDVIGGVFPLPEEGGNDLAPRCEQAVVGLGHVRLDQFVKPRQVVVGHQREHVVFQMVIHLPVQVAVDRIHVDRSAC